MLNKLLKEVVVIVVGKQAEQIADLLDGKKYVNEFLIAKKLDITINQARNILYKLSDQGLVSSIRKKDKKKGWYTYFWKIEIIKSLEFLRNILLKKIEQLNYHIKSRESKQFYVCEQCGIEYNEENALLHDFTCNECGEIFTSKDNTKVLKEFNKNLEKLIKELSLVDKELGLEVAKVEKVKEKEIKKLEKEKTERRLAKRKALVKQREKLLGGKHLKKKIVKKKSKKKIVKKKNLSKKNKRKSKRSNF